MARSHVFLVATYLATLSFIACAADDERETTAETPRATPIIKIVHVATGKVLGVEDDSEDSGTPAKIVDDAAKDKENVSRQWKLVKAGSFYKIVNAKSNNVLDVSNESTDEDGAIIVWDDKPDADGNDNQRWSLDPKPEAKDSKPDAKAEAEKPRRIKSKSSNLVLDVDDQGMVLQRRANEKAKTQLWIIVEIKSGKAEK